MSEKPIPNPHDRLFKEAFSRPDLAAGFFQNYLPEDIRTRIDWQTLQLQPGAFVDESLQGSESDLLYTVQIDRHPSLLYCLFEHQSTPPLIDIDDSGLIRSVLLYLYSVDNHADLTEYARQAQALNQPHLQEELMTIAEQLKNEGIQQGIQEGLQDGLQQGMHKEASKALRKILAKRFGAVPDAIDRQIQAADTRQIETWIDAALDVQNLDEIFQPQN
jgi:predicted transposase YdaD